LLDWHRLGVVQLQAARQQQGVLQPQAVLQQQAPQQQVREQTPVPCHGWLLYSSDPKDKPSPNTTRFGGFFYSNRSCGPPVWAELQ
jgi:hypothetical protein